MSELPDGAYDALIVDVEESDDGSVRVEVAITSGAHKGALIALRASRAFGDAATLLGMPGTLRVVDGAPRFAVER